MRRRRLSFLERKDRHAHSVKRWERSYPMRVQQIKREATLFKVARTHKLPCVTTLLRRGVSAKRIALLVREFAPELLRCERREGSETLPEPSDEPKEKGHAAAVKRWRQTHPERVERYKREEVLRKAERSLRFPRFETLVKHRVSREEIERLVRALASQRPHEFEPLHDVFEKVYDASCDNESMYN